MSSIFRKPDGTIIVTVRITLKPGRDDELIALIDTAPARRLATVIREAMRSGTLTGISTDEEDDIDLSGMGTEL